MDRKKERIYTTGKVDTFLGIDKKKFIGLVTILLIYLLACIVAFVEYLINGVDIVHIAAVVLLFVIGVIPMWILVEGYLLSRQAVKVDEKLQEVEKGVISWKALSKLCNRKNSVRLVNLMIMRGFLTGMHINIEHKALILEEKYKAEKARR